MYQNIVIYYLLILLNLYFGLKKEVKRLKINAIFIIISNHPSLSQRIKPTYPSLSHCHPHICYLNLNLKRRGVPDIYTNNIILDNTLTSQISQNW